MEEETKKLLELVKKCIFFNIDYDDGIVFKNKFLNIFYFLTQKDDIDFYFRKGMMEFENGCDNKKMISKVYGIFKKQIKPNLTRIHNELVRRGIKL